MGLPAARAVVSPSDVYQEVGGIVVMEAENTPSSLGTGTDRWELYMPGETNYVEGASSSAHLEFQGNYPNGAPTGKTPLTYKFKINEGGIYQLHIRSKARLDGAAEDKNNDCYVKVAGLNGSTYDAGPNAGGEHMDEAIKSLLTANTKMYVNSPVAWGWANLLDAGGSSNKRWPVYQFQSGGTYELTVSGRSGKFNFDRIIFRKTSIVDTTAKSTAIPESTLNTTPSTTPAISRVMLVNADTDDDAGVLSNGGTINLATMGPNLSLRVDTSPPVIGSVRFNLDGNANFRVEDQVPYSIGGDNIWDDYLPWTPTTGNHTLMVTPYSTSGVAGTPVTLNFTVSNQLPAGTPVANAGADQSVTLPTKTLTLAGSGSDPGGAIASYKWDMISGPFPVSWSSALIANPVVADLAHGTYKFRLTVTDNSGLSGYDDMTVTVLPAATAPVANAGPDKTISLPTNSVTLTGSGTDPANQFFAYLWTQLSGPSLATRSGESSTNFTASNLIAGTYVFRFRYYSETGLVGADDAVVTVLPATGVPLADAGADQAITLPTSAITLNGSGSDPGGAINAHAWSQVSGPSTASLAGAGSASLTASALVAGSYVFRLTVTDNSGLTASDDVTVTVSTSAGSPPVANAGADKAITLPASSVTLNGSGSDPGGSINGHAWIQVSGPSAASLSGTATANLTASSLVAGSYLFRLTVTDNSGLTASDDAMVTVNAASGGNGQSVTSLVLINADTDQDIGPMSSGMTINLALTPNLSVRAETNPMPVGSVRFSLDGTANLRTESGPPYAIAGDSGGVDYAAWVPSLGSHTLTATPYTGSAGGGTAGTPLTITFTVVNNSSDGITGRPTPLIEQVSGGQQRIRFRGLQGIQYRFERSTDLSQWTTLQTATAGLGGVVEFTDTAPPAQQAWYRLATP
ncbi:PKD domain-containing protein [Haloferula sp. BvORR071]|uniref:PKD domain-containing protein n=1 Tax=Haloferula sp. BvORR071 TaxID=1396141 RepID=UPI00054F8212|nr:PKD domain-containing protein [Haloferula sp. BvORR071]